MSKRKQIDFMKYIPIALMAVSLVSGYTLLQARMSSAEDKIKSIETMQSKLSQDSTEIRVSQAKTESTVQAIYDVVKNLKK